MGGAIAWSGSASAREKILWFRVMPHESIVTGSANAGLPSRRASAIALSLVVAVSAAAGCLVFFKLVLAHRPPGWDEAGHALQGALIAHDIRAGDLLGLLFDTYRQVYWPPLHSWLVGAAFLVTGHTSMVVARATSVLAYALLAPTLFFVARMVEPRHGLLAGSFAAGLALTSPGLIGFAARSMLELPGLLALSCTMLVYCRLETQPDAPPRSHALLGVCTVLTYLVKTNYGVLLVISIVLTKLIAVRFRPVRLLTRQNLYAVLPLVVFCLIWFAYPAKIWQTWGTLVNHPYGGKEARGLAGILFYPRAFIRLSGFWWMAVLLWTGLASAWRTRRKPGVAFLAVLSLTLFVISEFHHTKFDRHILPMFPPMIVLTGIVGARFWASFRPRKQGLRFAAVGVLSGVAVLIAIMLALRAKTPAIRGLLAVQKDVGQMAYISSQVREFAPVLIVGTVDAWPQPPNVDWYLVSEDHMPVTAAGYAMNPRQERRLAVLVGHARIPETLRWEARRVFGRYDAPTMTRSLYALWENQVKFQNNLAATLEADPPQAIIAIVGTSNTAPYRLSFIASGIAKDGYRQTSVRDFPSAASRVYVYRRP